jgi:hypothetical protein
MPALGYGLTLDRPVVVTVGPRSTHIKVKTTLGDLNRVTETGVSTPSAECPLWVESSIIRQRERVRRGPLCHCVSKPNGCSVARGQLFVQVTIFSCERASLRNASRKPIIRSQAAP